VPLHDWSGSGIEPRLICDLTLIAAQASFDTNTILGGNIPTSGRHLWVLVSGQGSAAATAVNLQLVLNNDTGANYYRESSQVNGSTPTYGGGEAIAAANAFMGNIPAATVGGNRAGFGSVLIASYAGTTFGKNILVNHGYAQGITTGNLILDSNYIFYNSSSAVTRVAITLSSGNFIAGSQFTVYAI
jgi:hypothetical protein